MSFDGNPCMTKPPIAVEGRGMAFDGLKFDTTTTTTQYYSTPAIQLRIASMRDAEGNSLLHWAVARNESSERVKALMTCGIDVNAQNYQGHSALFLAAAQGLEQMVYLLLAHGANPNLSNLEETTPLMAAACSGYERVVRLLLSFGAHVNACDEEGDTALHIAIREQREGVVRILLCAGADVRQRNDDGEDAFALACCLQDGEMMDCLSSSDAVSPSSSPTSPAPIHYSFASLRL